MPRIKNISAHRILDSRGEWTVEVRLSLNNGVVVKASVPKGKSSGKAEAETLESKLAISRIERTIAPALRNANCASQRQIDDFLVKLDGTPNKKRLGGNSLLAVSMACARAAAASSNQPLWRYLRRISHLRVPSGKFPRLFLNMINGGLHANNNLNFQEYLVITPAEKIFRQVRMATEFFAALRESLEKRFGKGSTGVGDEGGFAPNFRNDTEPLEILSKVRESLGVQKKVLFGLDAAASNINLNNATLARQYKRMISDHDLFYLEDPFKEEDYEAFEHFLAEVPKGVWVCGDDLTTTNVFRMRQADMQNAVNCMIVKPNQIGTITETIDAVRLARDYKWHIVMSHRSGETNDDFIADLAFGVGADGFKIGAPNRGERIAKFNRLLEVEKEIR